MNFQSIKPYYNSLLMSVSTWRVVQENFVHSSFYSDFDKPRFSDHITF